MNKGIITQGLALGYNLAALEEPYEKTIYRSFSIIR